MADTCASLAAEIAALRREIARIPKVDENALKTSIKASLEPGILSAVAGGIAVAVDKLKPRLDGLDQGLTRTKLALDDVRLAADLKAAKLQNQFNSDLQAAIRRQAAQDAAALRNATQNAVDPVARSKAGAAISDAAAASRTALNAASEATGLKGLVNGLGSKINAFGNAISKIETAVGDALLKAGEAIGISKNALTATGRLAGQVLQIFNVIGTIFAILDGMATREVLGARLDAVERGLAMLGNDVSGVLGRLFQLINRVAGNESATLQAKNLANEARSLSASATSLAQSALSSASTAQATASTAQATASTALNEIRQTRNAIDAKIADANRKSNDALYETRANRQKLEADISKLRSFLQGELSSFKTSVDRRIEQANIQIAAINSSFKSFQNTVNNTIAKFQSELATLRAKLDSLKQPPPVDVAAIIGNAVTAARGVVMPVQAEVSQLSGTVDNIQAQNISTQRQLDNKFNEFVASNNQALGIRGLQESNLSQEFNRKLADFNRQNNLTADQRFNEFKNSNEKILGLVGFTQSKLSQEFDAKVADFKRQANLTSDQRFEEFQRQNKDALNPLKVSIQETNKDNNTTKADIAKINAKLKEQEKLNDSALPKLDQILTALPLIPALAANAIRPSIPTIPQIETAAATGTCRTTQTGGCMRRALDDTAANIANNANRNAGNILDALNTGANAALLAGQQTILARLGAQLPGGIGGKLSRFANWMQLDRVLNIMILGATVHNALMLSNDIGQTLIGAINNVLQLIGLKKEDGSGFDIGSVISSSIENLIKGAIGTENYTNLTTAWAKANRIYQASVNILNSFQSLSSAILTGLEMTAGKVAKIGNALRNAGEVLENAYGWMNPQPKFNRVTQTLENLQQGASTIQMVTQAPLDVIEATTGLTTATTEFVNAIKQDENPANKGKESPEPEKLKADQAAAKTASAAFDLTDADLDADE